MPPPCSKCRGKRLSDSTKEEVYAILMDVEIWTRPDGPWYDTNYPGFAERVRECLEQFGKEVC